VNTGQVSKKNLQIHRKNGDLLILRIYVYQIKMGFLCSCLINLHVKFSISLDDNLLPVLIFELESFID